MRQILSTSDEMCPTPSFIRGAGKWANAYDFSSTYSNSTGIFNFSHFLAKALKIKNIVNYSKIYDLCCVSACVCVFTCGYRFVHVYACFCVTACECLCMSAISVYGCI